MSSAATPPHPFKMQPAPQSCSAATAPTAFSMQRATELVAHRSSHSPSSLRRIATAAIGIMLLLVAAVAFASSHPSPSSLVAHAEALPTHQQAPAAETSEAPVASPAKRQAAHQPISLCIISKMRFYVHFL
jgi:hypothetical protein